MSTKSFGFFISEPLMLKLFHLARRDFPHDTEGPLKGFIFGFVAVCWNKPLFIDFIHVEMNKQSDEHKHLKKKSMTC